MAKKTMFSTENIILLGVLGIGALYLYTKYKKSSSAIPETSNSNLPNDLNPKTSDGATIEIKGKDDLIETPKEPVYNQNIDTSYLTDPTFKKLISEKTDSNSPLRFLNVSTNPNAIYDRNLQQSYSVDYLNKTVLPKENVYTPSSLPQSVDTSIKTAPRSSGATASKVVAPAQTDLKKSQTLNDLTNTAKSALTKLQNTINPTPSILSNLKPSTPIKSVSNSVANVFKPIAQPVSKAPTKTSTTKKK